MSSIITFYSYKGGVGRTMALANIAHELCVKGLKILIVDWDLEAPGLERYFSIFNMGALGPGLLPILTEVAKGSSPDYKNYLSKIPINKENSIDLLHSGREGNINYSKDLESFNWDDFFSKKGGGTYLETLRKQWKLDYDIVLIDSRTGLSDTSGICTIFLPDVIIPMFTANIQSLRGVRDIIKLAQLARQKLANERMPLTILPVPTRFGTRAEFKESQEWLDRFAEELKEFYMDWLPGWITPKEVLEKIKIPQIDYFSFGEKLAVVEQGTNDPEGMGYIYSKIASFLASDFSDIESLMSKEYKAEKDKHKRSKALETNKVIDNRSEYKYDVFISYAHSSLTDQWIDRQFLPIFKSYLSEMTGRPITVFNDVQEIYIGEVFGAAINKALNSSKVLIPIITPKYLQSSFCLNELDTFLQRGRILERNLVFPIMLEKTNLSNSPLGGIVYLDLSDSFGVGEQLLKSSQTLKLFQAVNELAAQLAHELSQIPAFNTDSNNVNDKRISRK